MEEAAALDAEEVVETALDLISFDTTNPPGDTRDIVEYLESFFRDHDVDTHRVEVDERKPNLVAHVEGSSEYTLAYEGHLDTVPFDEDAWSRDPLGERVGDEICGRGANDMKGAVAAMANAVGALVEADDGPATDLVLALVSGEEVADSSGLPAVIESRYLEADGCLVGETTCEGGRHSVTVADRGSIWLTLEAKGRSAHGSRPNLGVNAVEELYHAYEDVESYLSELKLDLPDDVEMIVDESIGFYGASMPEDEARRIFEHPTVNLGVFEGGDAVNTVPSSARAEVDVRLTAGVDTERVVDNLRDILANHRRVSLKDVSWSHGTYEDSGSVVVEAAAEVAEGLVGEPVYRRSATGGGDAKNLRNAGLPTAEFALGTDTSHAVDEHTTVNALKGNAEFYASLPQRFHEIVER